MLSLLFRQLEKRYRRVRRLRPLGPVLLLGCESYRGEPRSFADGTQLLSEQSMGVLHFNNLRIAAIEKGSRHRVGVRFARLFRRSLQVLAARALSDPALRDVMVFQGMTWLRVHGHKVGFISEPVTGRWQRWWLSVWFTVLSRRFSPVRDAAPLSSGPRRFWLTRSALLKHFGPPVQPRMEP